MSRASEFIPFIIKIATIAAVILNLVGATFIATPMLGTYQKVSRIFRWYYIFIPKENKYWTTMSYAEAPTDARRKKARMHAFAIGAAFIFLLVFPILMIIVWVMGKIHVYLEIAAMIIASGILGACGTGNGYISRGLVYYFCYRYFAETNSSNWQKWLTVFGLKISALATLLMIVLAIIA
jgi:hypothetical protein